MKTLMDDEGYRAAYENLAALQERAKSIANQITERTQKRPPLPADTGAIALVQGTDHLKAGTDFQPDEVPGKGPVAELHAELVKVNRAIELQRLALERIRTGASKRIVQSVTPNYRRAVSRMAAAATELLAAQKEEEGIRHPLYVGDVEIAELHPTILDRVAVDQLETFLAEARSNGHTK